ncbi:hypothetical protein [Spirosoma sp. KNUC1025]|uniref:hypothetical protein n=1 Tax=Spirosoma sp. KNUC1025 TaxID=2894082 RepID=UPI00386AA844|nr:hypothetical protein LN737_27535 [Spirosoma sp. KNUC1025]
MTFVSARLIIIDMKPMVRFYEPITGFPMTQSTDSFAELQTPSSMLAIGSTRTLPLVGGENIAKAGSHHSAISECRERID